jgi:hypothetical protein
MEKAYGLTGLTKHQIDELSYTLSVEEHLDDATVEQVSEIIDNMNDDEFNKFMNNISNLRGN